MKYNEFTKEICKKTGDKTFKIRNSFGIYDVYKHIRKNKWYNIGRPLKEHEFYSVIRGVNNLLAENIANGETVVFPHRMGKLEIRKFQRGVSIVDGRLKIGYPIDWGDTLRLWLEDEEARKNKTLLRFEDSYAYHVRYDKYGAVYENMCYYQFAVNRFIKKALKDNIKENKIETLW